MIIIAKIQCSHFIIFYFSILYVNLKIFIYLEIIYGNHFDLEEFELYSFDFRVKYNNYIAKDEFYH